MSKEGSIQDIFFSMVRPFAPYVPMVRESKIRVPLLERIKFTALSLIVFLLCCQMPLFGINVEHYDPLHFMRVIMASNRFSLMEFGISPMVTSGMLMQILGGIRIFDTGNFTDSERELYGIAQTLLGLVVTLFQAIAYVLAGMYGPVSELGATRMVLIVLQLVAAGFVVLLTDDLLNKWGLGQGTSLFIATNICESILWSALSWRWVNASPGPFNQLEGSLPNLAYLLVTMSNKLQAFEVAFTRSGASNLGNLLSTVVIFLVVVYFESMRRSFGIKQRGQTKQQAAGLGQLYHIKLFYTSNMPIILLTSLVSNYFSLSQMLFRTFPTSWPVRALGTWPMQSSGQAKPTGGIAYYLLAPTSLAQVLQDPLQTLVYLAFSLTVAGVFAATWIYLSQRSPEDVDRQLTGSGYERIDGQPFRHTLSTWIPTAAALGGVLAAVLSFMADFLGAIGSGTGILLAANIISQYYDTITQDSKTDPVDAQSIRSMVQSSVMGGDGS